MELLALLAIVAVDALYIARAVALPVTIFRRAYRLIFSLHPSCGCCGIGGCRVVVRIPIRRIITRHLLRRRGTAHAPCRILRCHTQLNTNICNINLCAYRGGASQSPVPCAGIAHDRRTGNLVSSVSVWEWPCIVSAASPGQVKMHILSENFGCSETVKGVLCGR